ncbi:putative reverse transcriptase zinc-binding domain-containing protein [Helianthus annuus]|nr:putative reverse transcriptase zinc-binding domain-containing protein [Helianthus annuus]
MIKWHVRYKTETSMLWARLISAIHCGARCHSYIPMKSSIDGVWKSIVNSGSVSQNLVVNVKERMIVKVGLGNKTLFWLDNWVGNRPLRDIFPSLFTLESDKRCTVQQRYRTSQGSTEWFWGSSTPLTREEHLTDWAACKTLLCTAGLGQESDYWLWKSGPTCEEFTVCNLRAELDHINVIPEAKLLTWSHWIPKKVNCFLWRVVQDRIPTREALLTRRVSLPSSTCALCNDTIQSVDHLLVTCDFAQHVWCLIFQWLNITIPRYTLSVVQLLELIKAHKTNKATKRAIETVMAAACWNIWRTRNNLIFNHKAPQIAKIISDIKANSFSWVKSRAGYSNMDWAKWKGFKYTDFPI